MRQLTTLLLLLPLAACNLFSGDRPVPDLPGIDAKLAFTCAYEKDRIPPRDPEADQLYKHARWLKKNNRREKDPMTYLAIERLVRIATAYGHDKANLELRDMIARGQAVSEDSTTEILDLTEDLIRRGIPGGYYDMGIYLERGAGVKEDKELALKYYRKAADLGNPEAQYKVGDLLFPVGMAPAIAEQMKRCAAEQGHGVAALELGIHLSAEKKYAEALVVYQLGVKAGNDTSASFLSDGFKVPPTNSTDYLGQENDPERAERYNAIWSLLADYSYLHPKVPEIDEIAPLPPAKLPPWDGKLQWIEEHKANIPPPLPSEARIVEMAKANGLDPETGRPLAKRK